MMSEFETNLNRLIGQLKAFIPYNEQERRDREVMLDALSRHPKSVFLRSSLCAHMTASAWVISPDADHVLMAYHNIYHAWSWLGGHADGEEDLLSVAMKEAREEAGIRNVRPVSDEIFSLEVLTVDGHVKRDRYVSSHLHLNVTYLLEADEEEGLHVREGENSGVQWFGLDEAVQASSEPWFREHIYSKLNTKLHQTSC